MEFLIAYDVSTDTQDGRKRLRKVAQVCKDYGQRVQKSVFECSVDQVHYEILVNKLLSWVNLKEDSLRIYRLREPKERYIKEYGINKSIDFSDPLIL